MDAKPRHEMVLEESQRKLRSRFGDRVWGCKTCDAVLGVFNEDFTSLEIESQRVDLTIRGGQVERTCYRCDTVNRITTRGHREIQTFLSENHISAAYVP